MEDLISIVRRVNEEVYNEISPQTRLGYWFNHIEGKRFMTVYSTINIFGEPYMRKADKFIQEFNKNSNITVSFKREYSNHRGSELLYEGPIFFVDKVKLVGEDVNNAANIIKKILEDFYNSL